MATTTVDLGNVRGPTGAPGPQGAKGATGARGSQWYAGTGVTGTSTTATVFSGSGVASALVGDWYLNTATGNTYQCTTAGAASAARWVYKGSIKGATGATGAAGPRGPAGPGARSASLSIAASSWAGSGPYTVTITRGDVTAKTLLDIQLDAATAANQAATIQWETLAGRIVLTTTVRPTGTLSGSMTLMEVTT